MPAILLTSPLFGVSILKLGFPLLLLFLSLYIFGITLGLFVSAGLIRFGPSFENIAWSSLFLLAPLGCIYYPIEILPDFFQIVAKILPLVYIFDETRNILLNDFINYEGPIHIASTEKKSKEKLQVGLYLSTNDDQNFIKEILKEINVNTKPK